MSKDLCNGQQNIAKRKLLSVYLTDSVPLRTGTYHIRDILELFLQGYCALQESQMKMNFTLAVAPPLAYPMTSLSATPKDSV